MLQIVLLLFIVLDPFGNLVTLNSLLKELPVAERRKVIFRESLIAVLVLVTAVFAGGPITKALGLQPYALGVAGGIVLFMIAIGMVFPAKRVADDEDIADPLIVPIAIPLIAGPSSLSLIILLTQKHSGFVVASSVLIAGLMSTIILALSPEIFSLLGKRGSRAIERLMGMLLVMMAVQMILDGIQSYQKSLW